MLIKNPPRWLIPERDATDEHIYLNRRAFMKSVGAIGAGAGLLQASPSLGAEDPSAGLYPVKRNEAFTLDRPITPEEVNTTYNNFYEFGSHKRIYKLAQHLKIRPWTVKIDGHVEQDMTLDIDDLLKKMPLEERLYRHRCVEAWSMTVPWSGFPLRKLVELAAPTHRAKYVRFQTFKDRRMAPGQKQRWYPWPYTEGLTIDEAMNDLAFMVTGAYGRPLPKQMGSPLRLATPWKYGFKSIKSIVRITFTDRKPVSFWEDVQPSEYGFWANVNPEYRHPRWSQSTEQVLGTSKRVKTLLYNGYAEEVAALYKDMPQERKLFF